MDKLDWIMISVVLAFIVHSCLTPAGYSTTVKKVAEVGLSKYDEDGITCYVYKDSDKWGSLSCVKKEE